MINQRTELPAGFGSVILAGERPGGSPLSHTFNVSASVMVPVAGKPSLEHVVQAINDSQRVTGGYICGPSAKVVSESEDLKNLLNQQGFEWLEPARGPAASALSALEKLDRFPSLLTAGDHALLTGTIVDDFCNKVQPCIPSPSPEQARLANDGSMADFDFIIGFVPYCLVRSAFPESKRTVLKFSNGTYCGSNLFAVLSPAGLKALGFWRKAEAERKHPWRIAKRFGFVALCRYLFRRLTLEEALAALSVAAGCKIGYVEVKYARAAVDVDSIEDQKLAETILSGTQ